jgi:hypothetical protein
MATTYKVLGQVVPAATTNTTLYTVPVSTSAVCSTLTVCNTGVSTLFRVAVRPEGATLANQHYIVFNSVVDSNDTIFLTLGITLAATDVVTVYANTANVTFGLFGSEVV